MREFGRYTRSLTFYGGVIPRNLLATGGSGLEGPEIVSKRVKLCFC